eukprot:Polyplicarium_translucidae@DN559_c0_g1_i1.p1
MVKYCRTPDKSTKTCMARGNDVRVHFKNTHETASILKGMALREAQSFLEDVIEHKRCVPFRKFTGTIGRTAQCKEWKGTQGRWPVKSAKVLLGLLKNAEGNAEFKNIEPDTLKIWHTCVQRAQKGRRRCYRAHGRINPYLSHPCHIELILESREGDVPKPPTDASKKVVRLSRKQMAMKRLTASRITG